jgi:L,D-transpeptidase ErfK/SrfK
MITFKNFVTPENIQKIVEVLSRFKIRISDSISLFINKLKLFFKCNYKAMLIFVLIAIIPLMFRLVIMHSNFNRIQLVELTPDEVLRAQEKIKKKTENLNRKLAYKTPNSYYLVINSASNIFSLYRGEQLVKEDMCSTGSYILLKNGDQQQWMFKTPKGEFRILGKTTSPVWKKPDWAFVEEGLEVPTTNHYTRYEYGVLGDYALSLGDGYLIHGTLYQRFLGLPVTHGCIRLNDENLKLVYRSLNVGSKVYIY